MNWLERDAASVWHGFTQMDCYGANSPVIVERAEGRELIDVEGRRYLDAISSLWVTTLGHRVPELDQALREQLDRVAHSTMLGNGNRIVIEFAEALARVVPVDRAHTLFASDGAAAVEQALKIAFQYWTNKGEQGRTTYLAFGDGYHGDTIGSLSLGGGGFGTQIFDPLRFPVLRAPAFTEPGALHTAAQMVREHHRKLAAVVVEPLVQGAAGMSIAPAGDFAELGKACHETGVLLICDEVATGFGRTGTLFASEQCGLRPDLMCLGKGITGGYLPMSATVASQRVFAAFLGPDLSEKTLYHGHSYGGNALAAAVALKHLQLIASLPVLDNVRERSAQLRAGLETRIRPFKRVKHIRLQGLMGAVELDTSDDPKLARRTCTAMVKRGVLSRSMGPVITIVPPLTITAAEIERIVETLAAALEETA
ncbi:adenosylmethionine-8-amino-7-oxononanoate aminotransferase [Steroidobacter agaridevorans]|uniref:Adenosylmethionine-8-amino-7-oxononanoate aminotransferase n=1 Tax=Steroidobacter agaridevorans TaxID=2695856 RepID=A0A829YKA1_9GAMM|nr:adenosylmethionine--8-amino-7-oxononanoate transaminase [Steroidobacter agaridevorans]GFE83787.1 adenosylmethionine-8-amino-7-oxononanoate aminotransferase [Steroidobacter agaridevorans]GFE91625.1 adenosylmethionine-8-amino-7-oxononanoate aminotransferase [Steroidobacter agaridevorans]